MFDFPASPVVDQVYTSGGVSYRYNGYGWVITGSSTGSGSISVGDSPPVATDNTLWYETDSGMLWLRYNDGNSVQWVAVGGPPTPSSSFFLPLSGGTLSGGIAIQPGSGWASIDLKKSGSGQANVITGQTGTSNRWWLYLGDNQPETGSNVGSDFVVGRWSDAGASIDYPFRIARSNGQATFSSPLNVYQLLIKPGSGNSQIIMTGVGNEIYGFSSSNTQGRWLIQLGDGATESGSNVGSNFQIHRYADNGSYLGSVLSILRSTGRVTFPIAPDITGASNAQSGYVRLFNGMIFQWGYSGGAGGAASVAINFPIAFPTGVWNVQATMVGDPGVGIIVAAVVINSSATFTAYPRYNNGAAGQYGNATQGIYWMAIGY